MTAALPAAALPLALKVPGVRGRLLPGLGIPGEAIDYVSFTARFDTAQTTKALAGSGIAVPPLEELRGDAVGVLGAESRCADRDA